MSLSLDIERAYDQVRSPNSDIDWLILSFGQDFLNLECAGRGLTALRITLISTEIQIGLLQVESKLLLWCLIPSQVRGVYRAMILVNLRQIQSAFRAHQATFTFSSIDEFTMPAIRHKLRLDQPDALPLPIPISTFVPTSTSPIINIPPPPKLSLPTPPLHDDHDYREINNSRRPTLPVKPFNNTISEAGQRISMAPSSFSSNGGYDYSKSSSNNGHGSNGNGLMRQDTTRTMNTISYFPVDDVLSNDDHDSHSPLSHSHSASTSTTASTSTSTSSNSIANSTTMDMSNLNRTLSSRSNVNKQFNSNDHHLSPSNSINSNTVTSSNDKGKRTAIYSTPPSSPIPVTVSKFSSSSQPQSQSQPPPVQQKDEAAPTRQKRIVSDPNKALPLVFSTENNPTLKKERKILTSSRVAVPIISTTVVNLVSSKKEKDLPELVILESEDSSSSTEEFEDLEEQELTIEKEKEKAEEEERNNTRIRKLKEKEAWDLIDKSSKEAELERLRIEKLEEEDKEEEEEEEEDGKIYLDATEEFDIDSNDVSLENVTNVIPSEVAETTDSLEKESEEAWLLEQSTQSELTEVRNLLLEQQNLAKQLKEVEELQLKFEKRKIELLDARRNMLMKGRKGEILLSGFITCLREGESVVFRRRWFEIRNETLSLYRNESELGLPKDIISTRTIKSINHEFSPEESPLLNSFKLVSKIEDSTNWIMFLDEKEQKELFVIALELAMRF